MDAVGCMTYMRKLWDVNYLPVEVGGCGRRGHGQPDTSAWAERQQDSA